MSETYPAMSYRMQAACTVERADDVPNIIGKPELIDAWRHLRDVRASAAADRELPVGILDDDRRFGGGRVLP